MSESSKPSRRASSNLFSAWRCAQAFAAFALLAAPGCAATPEARTPDAHLAVRDVAAEVVLEGEGRVSGGELDCSSEPGARCAGAFGEVWSTVLEAHPAPGWRFAGWTRNAPLAVGSSGASRPVSYTAVFEPEPSAEVASGAASRR